MESKKINVPKKSKITLRFANLSGQKERTVGIFFGDVGNLKVFDLSPSDEHKEALVPWCKLKTKNNRVGLGNQNGIKKKNIKNDEEMLARQNLKRNAIKGLKAFGLSLAAEGAVAFLYFVVPKGIDLIKPGFASTVFDWTVNTMTEIGLNSSWKIATSISGIGFAVAGFVGFGVFLYSRYNSSNEHNGEESKSITNKKDEIGDDK